MTIWLLSSAIFAAPTLAAPFCPSTSSVIAGPKAVSNWILKSNVFGNPDRKTAKDFAQEAGQSESDVKKRYAASGDLNCDGMFGQGQLVLKGDVIVTVSHILHENRECGKPRDLSTCRFSITQNGRSKQYEIESVIADGYICPTSKPNPTARDWAILRLKKWVDKSVTPYKVGKPPCASAIQSADVVNVGKSEDWGRVPGKNMEAAARHYGNCQVHNSECSDNAYVIESDCDNSLGSSGGGLFQGGKKPELVAIDARLWDGCPDSPSTKTGEYKPRCWSSASVPIAGELRSKLKEIDPAVD